MATNNPQHHKLQNNGFEEASLIVLMVFHPAHTHMDQLWQVSCPTSHNSQVKAWAHAHGLVNPKELSKTQFHDFPTPPFVPDANFKFSKVFPYFCVTNQQPHANIDLEPITLSLT